MIVSCLEDGLWEGCEHVISTTRGAWCRAGRSGTKGQKVVRKGGGDGESSLVSQKLGGGRERFIEASPKNAEKRDGDASWGVSVKEEVRVLKETKGRDG